MLWKKLVKVWFKMVEVRRKGAQLVYRILK